MAASDQRVVVTDLRIPFLRLVFFFVKATLAAIPAAIIVAFLVAIVSAFLAAIFGAHGGFVMQRWSF